MAEEKEEIKVSVKKKLAKKDEEIEKAHADMEHWKNEYYRVYADMANLRKDIEKDHREVVKYRIEGFGRAVPLRPPGPCSGGIPRYCSPARADSSTSFRESRA